MSYQVHGRILLISTIVSLASYNLQQYDPETKHIRFCGKSPKHHILWWHVATTYEQIKMLQPNTFNEYENWHYGSYYVPTTLLVLSCSWSPWNILAMPKSEIFGFISASRRILLVFRSLWIILNLESWWRYRIPRAIPLIISKRFSQSNMDLLVWSTTNVSLYVYSHGTFW